MQHTVFSGMSTEELISFATGGDNRSQLEIELAQRLQLALDFIEETQHGDDPGSEGEEEGS